MTEPQRDYAGGDSWRIVKPLRRKDENSDAYDLTRVFMEELIRHPFAPRRLHWSRFALYRPAIARPLRCQEHREQ